MSKKNKAMLKNLVKECLIEILAEGLINNNKEATVREKRELRGMVQESYDRNTMMRNKEDTYQKPNTITQNSPRPSYLDSIKMGISNAQSRPVQANSALQNKVKRITNDPVMSDILADTAITTLQEQNESRRATGPAVSQSGDKAAKIVDSASPEQLFGDSASKWANLAFAPSIRK